MMLGQWRIVLKQAEESAKAGRLNEALALTTRTGVSDHRLAVQLRARLASELLARAGRRAEAEDAAGAIEDLNLAESAGAAPDQLAVARLRLAEKVAWDVQNDLDAGEPGRVIDRIVYFAERKIGGPALHRALEAAQAWRTACGESRRGEFGRALESLDRAERLAADSAKPAIEVSRREIEKRRLDSQTKIDRLYQAIAENQATAILTAAEDVLAIVPEHPAARDARTKAWRQIGALSPIGSSPPARPAPWANRTLGPLESDPAETSIRFIDENPVKYRDRPTEPFQNSTLPGSLQGRDPRCPCCGNAMQIREGHRGAFWSCIRYPNCRGGAPIPDRNRSTASLPANGASRGAAAETAERSSTRNERFLLWADAIGGYLVCPGDRVVIGRAGGGSRADIPLMGDLAPDHATIVRDEDGYLIESRHRTAVNGKRVERSPLRDGDVIRLGSTVELEFRRPSPVSVSARLSILSRHRLPLTVDGVILLGDTCVIGPPGRSHVPAANVAEPIVLYRQGNDLWCRAQGGFEVDGKAYLGRARLGPRSTVHGEGFSFGVEPLDPSHTETV